MNILFFLTPKVEVAYITTDITIGETLEIMENKRFSVIPMIDKNGKYIGTMSEGDLLYNIKNRFSYNFNEAKNQPILSLERKRSYDAISVNATLHEVFNKSMYENFVPVVDDDNTFIGIIKRRDIIHYLLNKFKHL